jgi:retron-type reverse transcriptase
MKRQGNLYHQIIAFENLLISAKQAQRSKRFRPNVLEFNFQLEAELERLQTELQQRTYTPGEYKTFRIFDPKPRLISAAPYRDRVVHHALCNVIMPIIDRTFIGDSYANRTRFGTHLALRRFTKFARASRYVLQCDIRLYFPSIDHEILKTMLRLKIKCPDTLWLIDHILDHSNVQEPVIHYFLGDDLLTPINRRHGLPIGNLTSQFFANVYLSGFDRFIKERLRIRRYLRYVDDFALFSDDRAELVAARPAIEDYLATLRLKLHPIKSQLFETSCGANFVGFRVLPDRIRVRNDNLRRGRRRLKQLQQDYEQGKITWEQISHSYQSWNAHLQHGDTDRLRQDISARWTPSKLT